MPLVDVGCMILKDFLKWLCGKNVSCILWWFKWWKKVVSYFFPSSKLYILFV